MRVFLCFSFLLIAVYRATFAQSCTWVDTDGAKYDLSPLKKSTDYQIKESTGTYIYYLNVCQPIVYTLCGQDCANCQTYGSSTTASLGKASTMILGPGKIKGKDGYGITASYLNGLSGRNFEIDFVCEPTAGVGEPTFTIEDPKLHYKFQWNTKYGCPVNEKIAGVGGLSGGSIILITLLVVTVVYFVGGVLLLKFWKKKEGTEVVPNVEFWISIPGLVRDGGVFIVQKIRGGKSSNYQGIPS